MQAPTRVRPKLDPALETHPKLDVELDPALWRVIKNLLDAVKRAENAKK